jgi:hypothetical protein
VQQVQLDGERQRRLWRVVRAQMVANAAHPIGYFARFCMGAKHAP